MEPQEVKQTPGSTRMTAHELGKCPWINTRGKSRGTVCNKTIVNGVDQYCWTHMRSDPTLQKPIEPEETESLPDENLVSEFKNMLAANLYPRNPDPRVALPLPLPQEHQTLSVPISSPLKYVVITPNEVKFVFN